MCTLLIQIYWTIRNLILYSRKLSRKKTFSNSAVLWLSAKVFSMKIGGVAFIAGCVVSSHYIQGVCSLSGCIFGMEKEVKMFEIK